MPMLTKPLLSHILDNDLLTRGLGDPEARMLVEWSTTESFKTAERAGFADALPETDCTANMLLEHLPAATVVRLLEVAAAKLRSGGVLVAETINPLSPIALRNYFADLTHAQPLVPETLDLLARQAGFASVETRFLNEPEEKLAEPTDPTIAANVRRLNELLFAPLDYAIVART